MFQLKEKEKLIRKERQLIKKLRSSSIYKKLLYPFRIFSPVKTFLIASGKGVKKILGIISLTTYKGFGIKVGYIDDFIVHKKARGKGFGKKLISDVIKKSEEEGHDYITLVSGNKRKLSHEMYKKIGFTVVSLGAFVFAIKKTKKKK